MTPLRLYESTENTEEEAEDPAGQIIAHIVLWTFVSLLLSCAVINLRHRVPLLPMSGLMMLMGIFLRCVGVYFGELHGAVSLMDNVNSEAILLVFLPALIAECAISLDWYTFKREFFQILILATTVVLMSSVLTATVIKFVLGYDKEFDWYGAIMMGAIFSATDHVSVVAILKDVKADDRFQTLMQGETLLNDGTVLVLFYTMMSSAEGSTTTANSLISLFCRLSFGGIALGIGFSLVLSLWLYRVVNHVILETLLTVVTAYLLFFTAELKSVHVSGGLATVAFGLYMSAFGKTFISPRIEHSVHQFWKFFGTIAESLILILGGALMGSFFIDFETLHHSDIGTLIALFALLHVIRAITIGVHWPVLRLLGYGCSWRQGVVLVFGALKGTISIALSLIVYQNPKFPDRVGDLALFWAVGVSALCISIDSMILGYLVRLLGLENMTDVQENMLVSFTTSLLHSTNTELKKLIGDSDYSQALWHEVKQDCGFDLSSSSTTDSLLLSMLSATRIGRRMLLSSAGHILTQQEILEKFSDTAQITKADIIHETRRRFFTTLKRLYWHRFEHGQCFRYSALTLMESADRSLDNEQIPMCDWDYLKSMLLPSKRLKVFRYLARWPLVGNLCMRAVYWHITRAYDIAKNFIKAHGETREMLDEMEIDINKEVFEEVMKESEKEIQNAKLFLTTNITDVYPEVCHFVQTYQARSHLLYSELSSVEVAFKTGIITRLEYAELLKYVKRRIVKLEHGGEVVIPSLTEAIKACYLFEHLQPAEIEELAANSTEEMIEIGERLTILAEAKRGIYVILKGRMRERGQDYETESVVGDVIGTQYLLPGSHLSHLNIESEAIVATKLVRISVPTIQRFLKDAVLDKKLWILCARKAVLMVKEQFGELGSLDAEKLNVVFTHCELRKYGSGADVPCKYGTILLSGSLRSTLTALTYIPGNESTQQTAASECVTLEFNEDFGSFVNSSGSELRIAIAKFNMRNKPQLLRMSTKVRVNASRFGQAFPKKALPGMFSGRKDSEVSLAPSEGEQPLISINQGD